ncbi:hypothetical protein KP509_06G010800 [Ceratopteris richardii]|nr:hypothetical protein KP509_06G010800 [Ceratopteris richardii]
MLRSQPPLPLLQRQKGQLFGLQRSIELLTLSEERIRSVCLVCADIFKKIRDAGRFVDRIQIILHASTWKSQVSDLQRLLEVDLRKCLSLDNVKQVDEAHLKLTQLSKDLHRYQKRLTVHVVSGLARVNQRAIHGTSCLIEMVRRHMQRDSPAAIAHETNTRDVNDNALQPVAETDHSVGRMLTSFCDVLVRLNRIEKNIFVVCVSLQTLVTALSSAHGKDVSSDIIQWLRDDSSMFDGVANCIRDCHSRLRDDLKDLRDVLAHCFRFLSEAWSWASPHSQLTSA